jgi:hypothetical protein
MTSEILGFSEQGDEFQGTKKQGISLAVECQLP